LKAREVTLKSGIDIRVSTIFEPRCVVNVTRDQGCHGGGIIGSDPVAGCVDGEIRDVRSYVDRIPTAVVVKRNHRRKHAGVTSGFTHIKLETGFETGHGIVRTVATDGHRLALCEVAVEEQSGAPLQVIIPRKGVLELHRLLGEEGDVELSIGSNHIRATVGDIRFTSKLIDGRFPDYDRVIPTPDGNVLKASREYLRGALQRAAILSNEKYRGIRLGIAKDCLQLQANNPEQEEAQDELEVEYDGEDLEIGFNVNYLLDALAAVEAEEVKVGFVDTNSSCIIQGPDSEQARFVVMPMRL
jgi:DNA polymerase III beta subunit